jgi:predicted GNAT family N-acyltransferase
MAIRIIDYETKEYWQMINLRNEILRKPLGLLLTDEDIKNDKNNILIGAFEEDKMLGCCMLVEKDGKVLLRQLAVKNDLQGKGIGRVLMDFAENIARDIGYREMSMQARKNVSGFYEKLGYKQVGEDFITLGIPHIIMRKKL